MKTRFLNKEGCLLEMDGLNLVLYDNQGNGTPLHYCNIEEQNRLILFKTSHNYFIWRNKNDLYVLIERVLKGDIVAFFQTSKDNLGDHYDLRNINISSFKRFSLRKIQSSPLLQSLIKEYIQKYEEIQIQNGTIKLDDDGKFYFVKSYEYLLDF